jgi:hypothetical protein
MGLDLRLPLGLMFSLIGLILLGYGLLTWGSSQYALSLGINVNLAWGAVMLVFGATMFLLGWRARKHDATAPKTRSGN